MFSSASLHKPGAWQRGSTLDTKVQAKQALIPFHGVLNLVTKASFKGFSEPRCQAQGRTQPPHRALNSISQSFLHLSSELSSGSFGSFLAICLPYSQGPHASLFFNGAFTCYNISLSTGLKMLSLHQQHLTLLSVAWTKMLGSHIGLATRLLYPGTAHSYPKLTTRKQMSISPSKICQHNNIFIYFSSSWPKIIVTSEPHCVFLSPPNTLILLGCLHNIHTLHGCLPQHSLHSHT